ncbi:hypothetical protein E2562_009752 [Oryza meyeriana var. granulata]|uniref:Uncharacterized protein n=1 Tax=Oryza meyeriana var. granulata TaxID=110450 RepID=A0A6G1D1Y3_9ORYZ|nr:hypothetical protein E2562_009752 [Oryza meyeriana var. granulata]
MVEARANQAFRRGPHDGTNAVQALPVARAPRTGHKLGREESRTCRHGRGRDSGKRAAEAEAEEYHYHDFEWEDLHAEVEANPAFSYHLTPFPTTATTLQPPPSSEA